MTTILSLFEIPLSAQNQEVTVTLGGVSYTLVFRWLRGDLAMWAMDVIDPSTLLPIAAGLAVVTGTDILRQLKYLGIGGPNAFMATYTDGSLDSPPTFQNLGSQGHVVYGVTG